MNINFAAVCTAANRCVADMFDRTRVIETALVYSVVADSSLPGSTVASPRLAYDTVARAGIVSRLGEFNENCVINLDRAATLAYGLWMIRYNAAFPQRLRITPGTMGFVDWMVRADTYILPEDHEFLNKYKREIALIAQLFSEVAMTSTTMLDRAAALGL